MAIIDSGDPDPLPQSSDLLDVWRAHFEGNFAEAKAKGLALGSPEGKYIGYRAQTIYALYLTLDPVMTPDPERAERTILLKEVSDELTAEIKRMETSGQIPSMQMRFWQYYASARYMEIMKSKWGLFVKKDKVTELLDGLDSITGPAAGMPSLRATYAGTIAAVAEDGFLAKRTFRKRVRDCAGKVTSFEEATVSQFNCALKELGENPFPELMEAYAMALERLGIGGSATEQYESADTYRQYASGKKKPKGVSGLVFTSEDILARESVRKM